jgi:hypothetical protein
MSRTPERVPDLLHRMRRLEHAQSTPRKPITSWEDFVLTNGWTATTTGAAFHKDSTGYVHLRGAIVPGQFGQPFAELPDGYPPANLSRFPAIATGITLAQIDAYPDGTLVVVGVAGSAAWIALDSIHFRAAV